jgi:hypothetical protein
MLFSKTTSTAANLEAAQSRLKKAQDAFVEAKGRSRVAEARRAVAVEKLESARALAVEAASRGDQPASLRAAEEEERDAQNTAKAYANAANRAADTLTGAQDAYSAAAAVRAMSRLCSPKNLRR